MRAGTKVALAAAVAAAALAAAACSGSSPGTTSPPSRGATRLTPDQALPPLLQCFIDHHLIAGSVLDNGTDSQPPSDVSTWTKDGQVIANDNLGDWFSVNSNVVVQGKSIGDWMTAVEISRKNWPARVCGPMPPVS
jgi:hypothetical protein